MRKVRTAMATITAGGLFLAGVAVGWFGGGPATGAPQAVTFSKIVNLSHVNDPNRTPGFPGDPAFETSTAFTVANDGFYLQYVKEGEHTGTHWGAPCHFHAKALCADQLSPEDLLLPAVVVDVRQQVLANVDYEVTVADLKAWESSHGSMPAGAAVIAWTGCSSFWPNGNAPGEPTYYNCGTHRHGFHQPGFSLAAVRWLIRQGVLGERGALGSDTFGPDPGTDERFRESSLVFHRHRIDLENMTGLGQLPASGAWILVGGQINRNGSGSPATIWGLVP